MVISFDNFTKTTVFGAYPSLNYDAYKADDGKYYAGVGLGGFTGPNCKNLFDFAKSKNIDWYDIAAQTAFLMSDASGGLYSRYQDYKSSTTGSSPSDAGYQFGVKWEGNPAHAGDAARTSEANEWAEKVPGYLEGGSGSRIKSLIRSLKNKKGGRGKKDNITFDIMIK